MTASDLTVVLILVGLAALVGAFLYFTNFRKLAARKRSQCGKKVHPNGTTNPAHVWLGPKFDDSYGGDYSPGVPDHPMLHPEGFAIPIPIRSSHGASGDRLNYVLVRMGPLAGKRHLRLKGRIEMGPGVRILAHNSDPADPMPGMLTMFFQREGDDWSARGKMETYRWYSAGAVLAPLEAGEFELVAPLDGSIRWNATAVSNSESNPAGFREALEHGCCAGFVAGGGNSYAHGFYATGSATLIVTYLGAE